MSHLTLLILSLFKSFFSEFCQEILLATLTVICTLSLPKHEYSLFLVSSVDCINTDDQVDCSDNNGNMLVVMAASMYIYSVLELL